MIHKYSKGKWKRNGIHILIDGRTGSQAQAFRQHIPCTHEPNFVDVEAIANAQLMASSPKLLEVCLKTKEYLESVKEKNLNVFDESIYNILVDTINNSLKLEEIS